MILSFVLYLYFCVFAYFTMAHCTCNRAAVCDYTVVLLHGTGHLPLSLQVCHY